jgi:hypothetical protein
MKMNAAGWLLLVIVVMYATLVASSSSRSYHERRQNGGTRDATPHHIVHQSLPLTPSLLLLHLHNNDTQPIHIPHLGVDEAAIRIINNCRIPSPVD